MTKADLMTVTDLLSSWAAGRYFWLALAVVFAIIIAAGIALSSRPHSPEQLALAQFQPVKLCPTGEDVYQDGERLFLRRGELGSFKREYFAPEAKIETVC